MNPDCDESKTALHPVFSCELEPSISPVNTILAYRLHTSLLRQNSKTFSGQNIFFKGLGVSQMVRCNVGIASSHHSWTHSKCRTNDCWELSQGCSFTLNTELSLHPSTGVMRHLMQKVPNELTTNPTQIFWRPLHLWSESLWSCRLTLNVGLAVKVFSGSWPETSPLKFIFSNALRSCPNPFMQNQGCKPTVMTSIMITILSVILVMCKQHSHWATPPSTDLQRGGRTRGSENLRWPVKQNVTSDQAGVVGQQLLFDAVTYGWAQGSLEHNCQCGELSQASSYILL